MKGRKKLSAEDRIAKGERRPSQVNYHVPEVPAPLSWEPPSTLSGAGLSLWNEYAGPMVAAGQLRSTDMPLFSQVCEVASAIERLEKKLRSRAFLNEVKLQLRIQSQISTLRNLFLRTSAELGMSPVSRSKVRTVSKAPVGKRQNERFFRKGVVHFKQATEQPSRSSKTGE